MPPSQMLGLPWPAWGETDVLLAMARRAVESSLCPCGCGQPAAMSTDEDTDGRWQVSVDQCFARAAMDAYRRDHEKDLPEAALMGVRLLPEGVAVADPLQRTVEGDREAYERMRAKRVRRPGAS